MALLKLFSRLWLKTFRIKAIIYNCVAANVYITRSVGYFTNEEIRRRVKNIYAQFVSDVDPDRLSDWLIQDNVITIDQWQRIRLGNPVRRDRCRGLLYHLFSIQHPRAFLVLRQAVEKEHPHLLESIATQKPECKIRVQPAGTQSALQGYCSHFYSPTNIFKKMTTWVALALELLERLLIKHTHVS